MRRMLSYAAAVAVVIGLTISASAHNPPGVIFEMWQWPSTHLPVLDADLSEWDVVPEELWITEQDLVQNSSRLGSNKDRPVEVKWDKTGKTYDHSTGSISQVLPTSNLILQNPFIIGIPVLSIYFYCGSIRDLSGKGVCLLLLVLYLQSYCKVCPRIRGPMKMFGSVTFPFRNIFSSDFFYLKATRL